MQFQLWMTDEYGQGSIIATSTDVEELVKRAKEEVTTSNVNNALAVAEKERNWEALFIELVDRESQEVVEDAVYAGKSTTGHHCIVKTDGSGETAKLADCDVEIQAYLGFLDRNDWYLMDSRNLNYITKIDDIDLSGKTVYYIRPTRQPKA